MTNRLAIVLAGLIALFLVTDAIWLHSGALVFLGREFIELVDYVAFWR